MLCAFELGSSLVMKFAAVLFSFTAWAFHLHRSTVLSCDVEFVE